MALTLDCSCGTRFEVQDTFAGQVVSCPECQADVQAPGLDHTPRRTSGLALASMVLALVGAFTVIFTLLAAFLGACALVSIRRQPERLAGAGYAVFGIVAGLALTVFSAFLYSNVELLPIDGFLETGIISSQVDYTGEREVTRPAKKFAITKPSPRWGVARESLVQQMDAECDVMLVNARKQTYVQVTMIEMNGASVDEFVDDVIKSYKEEHPAGRPIWEPPNTGFKLRGRRNLPPENGMQATELLVDLRVSGQDMTYLDRIVQAEGRDLVFRLRGWAPKRRFVQMEAEIRRALDSLRILP
jgi:hypothetical protein